MDEKLRSTLHKIKLLSDQNPEFAQALRKMFESTSSASVVSASEAMSNDIVSIRQALEIRADNSISYEFVKGHKRFKDQLIIDNLRMENAALDLQKSEKERFYAFCVNAFYQLENIINYYFHITYPDIHDLVQVIEAYTANDSEKYKYQRTGKELNVSSITINYKLNVFCAMFYDGDDTIKATLGTLRKVRNEGEHRWSQIIDNNEENHQIYKFYKYQTFNSVRLMLKRVVLAVQEHIDQPVQPRTIVARVSSVYPGACYVMCGDKTISIPNVLLNKVRGCAKDQEIRLSVLGYKILDVHV